MKATPEYLVLMIRSWLSDRELLVGENRTPRPVTCGFPQESVLGPTVWNMAYDSLLVMNVPSGVHLVGFANDLVVVGVARIGEDIPGSSEVQRATKSIMTSRLSAALDKCKVSDRDAVHLLTACIESFSLNPASYIINRTSIRNSRESIRKEIAEKIIVSTPNGEKLLGVPEIPSETGSEISLAVYDSLEKWSLLDKVQGFVFDTTASNTGRVNGASTL
ncbi:hypothetical protein AGLY_012176 [Aphis glycines]|uniref:Uncharacterized protein n=1 Tax=Aphis glycines TaxID=307491 RepID=A0A6G0TAN7_APHGL|nr:hypothetical protein AGLY_012176 [Aphis glycines]